MKSGHSLGRMLFPIPAATPAIRVSWISYRRTLLEVDTYDTVNKYNQ